MGTTGGCLIWEARLLDPELVFHCPFCTRRLGYDFEVRGCVVAEVLS